LKSSKKKMRFSLLIFILPLVFTLTQAEFVLIWADEFNGGNLNDRWNFETGCGGWGNNELQCYTDNRGENARQEFGSLIIQARKEWWGDGVNPDKQFTSARMTSKASWLHGKMEIRARMPKGKHLWPAIWMMPAQSVYGEWPRSGEIDIMEYRGQRWWQTMGTLHFGASYDQKGQVGSGERDFNNDFSQEWHTYWIDWSPSSIQWWIDDHHMHTETLQRNFWPGFYSGNEKPFDQHFFLILNMAVGGNFFPPNEYGNFDPEEANGWEKNFFEIDFVRVYQWQ